MGDGDLLTGVSFESLMMVLSKETERFVKKNGPPAQNESSAVQKADAYKPRGNTPTVVCRSSNEELDEKLAATPARSFSRLRNVRRWREPHRKSKKPRSGQRRRREPARGSKDAEKLQESMSEISL
ncbi:UNVERIFIED_CONTAM: hypothetical protein HHA_449530 [Hammondia hammondi]|eukprot:XP_008882232.1 hypothetical protein HHA_449530 [Hammondia hammondi]